MTSDPSDTNGATALDDDKRPAHTLSSTENADLCSGCVKCCTYITVEVDAPRAAWEYDQWIWALHHDTIELFVEKPERWFLHVATTCRQLDVSGRCKIHGRHPVLCREYDPRSCERRLPLEDATAWFHNAEELEAWLQKQRPRHWERLEAHRRAHAVKSTPATNGGLIPVEALVASSGRGSRGRSR
jgi:Fe-S-cluster containining protein